jgi:phosphomannomutase
MSEITCFKAYDVRGRVPDQLNEDVARRIGRAYAEVIRPRQVVVGHDIRLTSQAIKAAVTQGLREQGVDVYDIGQCGTEEIYFATSHAGMDGGIAVTASHNPKDYNGMKFVREDSRPISSDTGLLDIKALAERNEFTSASQAGQLHPLEPHLPFEFIKLHHEPDGNFPNGVPNPLLPENRSAAIAAVREHGADLGIGWDGDFDRCFFFDETGEFVEGYYLVGLLAEAFLIRERGARIVHDPRLVWNTVDIIESLGGEPVQSKCGHAFIKEVMRAQNAAYGGEMSAHHYFRDFAYCDSGMIPWLLVTGLISSRGQTLSAMVNERVSAYPCSGEINRTIEDPAAVLARVEEAFAGQVQAIDRIDGLSMVCDGWRFNLRMSNTEPVVRLNVESRGDRDLMEAKTAELLALIEA